MQFLIQVDLWDGDDGDPIIKHGYALTSEIRLQDVLKDAVKPYAFKKSEYASVSCTLTLSKMDFNVKAFLKSHSFFLI